MLVWMGRCRSYIAGTHRRLSGLPWYGFVPAVTLVSFVVPLVVLPLFFFPELFGTQLGPELAETESFPVLFILACVIAPISETFMAQWAPIRGLRRWRTLRDSDGALVAISALVFGLMHFYSPIAVIRAFVIGLVLAYAFVLYEKKPESAFWTVTAIHGLRNLISSVIFVIERS